jgi:hypothetical protein
VLGVSNVDGAKAFYQNLGWRCSRKSLPPSQLPYVIDGNVPKLT